MRLSKLQVLTRASPLLLLPFAAACVTAPSIEVSQIALPCWEMTVASGLLEATTGAPLPRDDTAGELGAFGDRQTGQLDKANADKSGVTRMMTLCEAKQSEAFSRASRRTKPWWKKIL